MEVTTLLLPASSETCFSSWIDLYILDQSRWISRTQIPSTPWGLWWLEIPLVFILKQILECFWYLQLILTLSCLCLYISGHCGWPGIKRTREPQLLQFEGMSTWGRCNDRMNILLSENSNVGCWGRERISRSLVAWLCTSGWVVCFQTIQASEDGLLGVYGLSQGCQTDLVSRLSPGILS